MSTINKLHHLHEIRGLLSTLDSVRSQIRTDLELLRADEQCLEQYRKEMDSLLWEKQAHVEELRAIHADINALECVQKQAIDERERRLEIVNNDRKNLADLTARVDSMCMTIGFPNLADGNRENQNWLNHDPSLDDDVGHRQYSSRMNRDIDQNMIQKVEQTRTQPTFRHSSAPPPMKQCDSCHQSIHRNAPICPLCKAKSRSKNPKRKNSNR
ncbi:hypothetical protein RDWZM_006438 [Blomia tropicalis]|uniref:C4H2-type domain-containing protein n=1 Tax=Blomia tropicalis TaxID=40697 RepID=A0A9Q0RND9_BLOTA|nr:Zinc finger C4H2 domain-containing protein [Blomia tropicalis]KAJ6220626.1 hypothetical protein RDWZM_006438 [Blomia tropicalis]